MLNDYKEITMYELNLLYLELKFHEVSPTTYGSYQDRAKVINEYLGDLKVNNIDSKAIEDFYDYMKNRKVWSYTDKISDTTINNIMSYLYTLLNKAIFWRIIPENLINVEINQNKKNKKDKLFIKERNDFLLDLEYKRISNRMNNVLN